MSFEVLERAWDPDTAANADWFWVSDSTAVLLDGAAPRGTERVSAAADDTVWLVRRFVEEYVAEFAAERAGVRERVERARARLKREYDALCTLAGITPDEPPFACLAIAELADGQLDLYNMGDLTTLVRLKDGSLHRFGDSAVRELDARALAEMRRLQQAGVEPHAERRVRVWPLIKSHREQRNRLPGYDVLDLAGETRSPRRVSPNIEAGPSAECPIVPGSTRPSPAQRGCGEPGTNLGHEVLGAGGADRLEHRRFDASQVRDVLMLSDGFYRLVDTLDRYTDATLFEALEQRGLAALLGELRELERSDPECIQHVRFKTHDDATALWLAVD